MRKTTLLKCINKILEPSQGRILLDSENVLKMHARSVAKIMGYVPQNAVNEFSTPTVYEVVMMGRRPHTVGLIVPFHKGESPVYDCPPEFMVIPAPTQRMAKERVGELAGETLEDDMDSYVCALGPYTDESECRDLVSYLKLKWKMEVRTPADQSTLSWTKNMINEYNITIGE